jgi:hypothetical protein
MYYVCTSLPFPSTDSLLLLLLRERERERFNFTYQRELIEIKATNSQPKNRVVDKICNGRGAVCAGKLHFTFTSITYRHTGI